MPDIWSVDSIEMLRQLGVALEIEQADNPKLDLAGFVIGFARGYAANAPRTTVRGREFQIK